MFPNWHKRERYTVNLSIPKKRKKQNKKTAAHYNAIYIDDINLTLKFDIDINMIVYDII